MTGGAPPEIARRSGENFRRLANLLEQTTGGSPGRILADAMWSMFLGLTIMSAARTNLGHADAHVGPGDRAKVFEVLKLGLKKGETR